MVKTIAELKAAALEADVAALKAAMATDRAEWQRRHTQRAADDAWKDYLAARLDQRMES